VRRSARDKNPREVVSEVRSAGREHVWVFPFKRGNFGQKGQAVRAGVHGLHCLFYVAAALFPENPYCSTHPDCAGEIGNLVGLAQRGPKGGSIRGRILQDALGREVSRIFQASRTILASYPAPSPCTVCRCVWLVYSEANS